MIFSMLNFDDGEREQTSPTAPHLVSYPFFHRHGKWRKTKSMDVIDAQDKWIDCSSMKRPS